MSDVRSYSTLVIFGDIDVSAAPVFRKVFEDLAREVGGFGIRLRISGYIAAERRQNVAPRASIVSDRTLGHWLANLECGALQYVDMYDSAFSNTSMPRVYAGFRKLWDYVEGQYTQDTRVGARCSVTLALDRSLVRSAELHLESRARGIAEGIEAVYGFIENQVQWTSQVHPQGGDRFINLRSRDIAEVDYGAGRFSMKSAIPRLYWGNILRPAHFRQDVPQEAIGRMEQWSEELNYLRFAKDPQSNPSFREDISGSFNLIS